MRSVEEIEAELRIGAEDPSHFDCGEFVRCTSAACVSQQNVAIYMPGRPVSQQLTVDTVFAIKDRAAEEKRPLYRTA